MPTDGYDRPPRKFAGTTDIVASPHANSEFPYDAEVVAAKIRELANASGHIIRIHRGCDFHLNAGNNRVARKVYLSTSVPAAALRAHSLRPSGDPDLPA